MMWACRQAEAQQRLSQLQQKSSMTEASIQEEEPAPTALPPVSAPPPSTAPAASAPEEALSHPLAPAAAQAYQQEDPVAGQGQGQGEGEGPFDGPHAAVRAWQVCSTYHTRAKSPPCASFYSEVKSLYRNVIFREKLLRCAQY